MAPSPSPIKALRTAMATHCQGRALFWGLDIDGTLSDLAESPDAAFVPPHRQALLQTLHRPPHSTVALVSGRDLAGIDRLLPQARAWGLIAIGSHGAELRFGDRPVIWRMPEAATKALREIRPALADVAGKFPGALIETKAGSTALHFRQVDPRQHGELTRDLRALLAGIPALAMQPAHLAWELRPAQGPHKGEALGACLAELYGPEWRKAVFPILAGDDSTDEDAFAGFGRQALSIRIGSPPQPTQAEFFLPTPAALEAFLEAVARDLFSA